MEDSYDFDSDSDDQVDHLQNALELAEPISNVRKEANILIVGDDQTGKSMLAWSFTRFPRTAAKRYHRIAINPAIGSNRRKRRNSIGLHFFCGPFKSGDERCFLRKSPISRPFDLVIYLFDVNRRSTLRNICYKWIDRIFYYMGQYGVPPSILVGNKIDLRPSCMDLEQPSFETVWTDEGEMSTTIVGAEEYVEVCALAEINTRYLLVKILKMLHIAWEPDF